MGRVEPGLQEDAAIGDGLQRGRALVGEPEADEELQGTNPVLVSDFFFSPPHRETSQTTRQHPLSAALLLHAEPLLGFNKPCSKFPLFHGSQLALHGHGVSRSCKFPPGAYNHRSGPAWRNIALPKLFGLVNQEYFPQAAAEGSRDAPTPTYSKNPVYFYHSYKVEKNPNPTPLSNK